ncbi:MAG TPA: CRISPR-associated endonuclease Cas2 [Candidatus Acidoferrum sp.]|nr:CRISPR-associated endonuclease Cas2 [Candidatus Acidoferrum sp.]
MLTGYRLMWMMVIFDLPVGTKKERRAATKFRQFLLDQGFSMTQFSVYMRFCGGKDQAEAHAKRIERSLPKTGLVQILNFTDKQYETIISYDGRVRAPKNENPQQYAMF